MLSCVRKKARIRVADVFCRRPRRPRSRLRRTFHFMRDAWSAEGPAGSGETSGRSSGGRAGGIRPGAPAGTSCLLTSCVTHGVGSGSLRPPVRSRLPGLRPERRFFFGVREGMPLLLCEIGVHPTRGRRFSFSFCGAPIFFAHVLDNYK